jgi:hypothetical protein
VPRRQAFVRQSAALSGTLLRDYALTHASGTASATHGATVTVPNEYGLPSDSHWDVSAQVFVRPSDYLLASAGVVTYQGRANPTGSELPTDPRGSRPDSFYKIESGVFFVSRHF